MLVNYASACVVLPGGFGTLDEMSEILTLIQTGKSKRIPIVLVNSGFWQGLVDWFERALVAEGTISEEVLELFTVVDDPQQAVEVVLRACQHDKDKAINTELNGF